MTTHAEPYENEVLREQLDYLIGHTGDHALSGCSECQRYLRVRSTLLEIFGNARGPQVEELPALARAA
jgi:hypothetical protein